MVKITYVPYQEVIVHEILEQDNQTFFEDIVREVLAQPVQAEPSVNWIDGIAFIVGQLPPTEDIVKENLNGKVHYAAVIFTKTEFRNSIPVRVGNQDLAVRLRKADNNSILVDLVKFLKTFNPSPDS